MARRALDKTLKEKGLEIDQRIGRSLAQLRTDLGLAIGDLADVSGCTSEEMAMIEARRRRATAAELYRFCLALECSPASL